MSSASPAPCPKLSLIVLKSSMSRNATAIVVPFSCRWFRACSTRSLKSVRLARPVRGSCNACCLSCSSSALRWPKVDEHLGQPRPLIRPHGSPSRLENLLYELVQLLETDALVLGGRRG